MNGLSVTTSPESERRETQGEHRMIERCPEVFPQRRVGARVIRGEEQRQHVDESADTRPAYPNAERQRNPDRELAVCDQKRERRRVVEHEMRENRDHER